MMAVLEKAQLPVSLAEAQAYVRIETGEEEALLAGMLRVATDICERFTGRALIRRPFTEILPASGRWARLEAFPVTQMDGVASVDPDGTRTPLAMSQYAVDVDAEGGGWVRLITGNEASRVEVSGVAGMAEEPNGVPEPIRQGLIRLVAHLFAHRDGEDGAPPAAVTALWRPYRRVQL